MEMIINVNIRYKFILLKYLKNKRIMNTTYLCSSSALGINFEHSLF